MRYPPARREQVADLLHGHVVPDPYRWLEDQDSAETRQWQAAQDELWLRLAAALPGRERFHARVAELSGPGAVTAPMWRGERRFFQRQTAGQEHAVLYTGEPERVLIDPIVLDPEGFTTLDQWQPDLDGRLLAYQLSRRGNERSELYVMDVDTARVLDGPIDRCRYSPVAWLPGGTGFYYVRSLPGQPAHCRRVYLHRVGTPADDDVLIFGDGRDEITAYGLGISHDGRWLTISAVYGGAGNDVWLADLAASAVEKPELRVVHEGLHVQTALNVGRDGCMYVATNLHASRGRLCVGDPHRPQPDDWHELVGEDGEAVLNSFTILDGPELRSPVLLVTRTRHAIGEIGVHDLHTGQWVSDVPLPGLGSIGSVTVRPDGGHEAWFTYTDSVTPPTVHRYDARRGETVLWKAGSDAVTLPDVVTRQLTCVSADGTPVRVIVTGRPSTAGPRPTILYGYGGFGIPLTPAYSSYVLAWVEAGGVFATANVRGGGEEGDQWHRAGMLEHKQNVFDDFIAVAEKLITDGWTTPEQLGICGESNGGLLVGAALTQRPDLFAAVVCSAPLLDMVRYERYGRGPTWRGEYGSASDPEQLRWLLGYSPYHRVSAGTDYPAVLFTTFASDSRVDPMHARKMCAALQNATAGKRPILLRHEADVGHGTKAASRAMALAGDMIAFLAAHTGLSQPPSESTGQIQIQPAS
jgi:prolyl oligopeptidase